MFDNIGRWATQAAMDVSRRQFLGQVGQWAKFVAVGGGGLLCSLRSAHAAQRVCWTSSQVEACRGKPLGSECVAGNNRPGMCVSDGGIEIAPGVFDCNLCKPKGRGR
jgi:hypothetical protein